MKAVLVVLLVVVVLAEAQVDYDKEWADFKLKYDKTYTNKEEEDRRYQISL
jgi:hypothetical protein